VYELALPPPLVNIHNIPDPSHILESDLVQVKKNLSFKPRPIKILDSQMKQLCGKDIPMVKVPWDLTSGDSTWKVEEDIRASYHNLFRGKLNFRG